MYVGEGSVRDIIDWFRRNSRATLLGFFVAGDKQFDKFLDDVVRSGQVMDLVLGSKIDLFLFGGNEKLTISDYSKEVTVNAVPLKQLEQVSDEKGDAGLPVIHHISQINKSLANTRKKIIQATALATHDIADLLKLSADDLPSLILMGRGKDQRLILRTRGHADAEFVIEFLRALRKVLESMDEIKSTRISVGEGTILRAETALSQIQLERSVVEKRNDRLERISIEFLESLANADLTPDDRLAKIIRVTDGGDLAPKLVEACDAEYRPKLEEYLKRPDAIDLIRKAQKAGNARRIAQKRIHQYEALLPPTDELEKYILLQESVFAELEAVRQKFDRKLSYQIGQARVLAFVGASTQVLTKAKKLIQLALAVKTGGMSLLK
jgi:hypothetical protein